MNLRPHFLALALGAGFALAAPVAVQAQVHIGVNIGVPAWGPPVPQGTQYYYIPEIDGYYDIYNGYYLVLENGVWVTLPYIDGYDPAYFHPVPVSYVGPQPWLYINSYRHYYPQYVVGYRHGGYGRGGFGGGYGPGSAYRGGYGGLGYGGGGYRSYPNGGYNRGNIGGPPRFDNRGNDGPGFPARGGQPGGNPGGGQRGPDGFGGGRPDGGQRGPGRRGPPCACSGRGASP